MARRDGGAPMSGRASRWNAPPTVRGSSMALQQYAAGQSQRRRLLIADDDPTIRRLLVTLFADEGYDLAEAGWSMVYLSTAVVHHHPSSTRDSAGRRRLLSRNALWTAWLRRPFPSACRETWRLFASARSDPAAAQGFSDALSNVRWLITRRRVLSRHIECQIRMLEIMSARQRSIPDRMSSSRQSARS